MIHYNITCNKLTPTELDLLIAAKDVLTKAYNPYSKFFVGAALLTTSGEIICGTNVENVSYRLTTCAEQVAICTANALGYRKFKAMAVIGGSLDVESRPITPCGACRQQIMEMANAAGWDIKIIMSNSDMTDITTAMISDLLPLSFNCESLKK